MDTVPIDWHGACTGAPVHRKGDKYICSNSIGINLLSVVGKLYGRALIIRLYGGTESAMIEEQWGFRKGSMCKYQVFALRKVFRPNEIGVFCCLWIW